MEISKYLRNHSRTIMGKQQLIVGSMAKALEIIPRQICDNAGLDATDILNKLRMRHAQGDVWSGVDVEGEGVQDNMKGYVWEPALVKTNALSSAVDAACLILSVDETVRNPQSEVSSSSCGRATKLIRHSGSASRSAHAAGSRAEGFARPRKGHAAKIDHTSPKSRLYMHAMTIATVSWRSKFVSPAEEADLKQGNTPHSTPSHGYHSTLPSGNLSLLLNLLLNTSSTFPTCGTTASNMI